jgi:hypothetical protein
MQDKYETGKVYISEDQINPGIEAKNPVFFDDTEKDPWKHRSAEMKCRTCMYYVEKISNEDTSNENTITIGRCRRNAPTMKGYPVVYPTDWCGEHKLDETKLLCG